MKEIEVRQKIEVEKAKREVWTNSIFLRNGDVTELRCSALRAENGGLRSACMLNFDLVSILFGTSIPTPFNILVKMF